MRLAGKTVLVVGAGAGIGRASAVRFAEEGAEIAVADLNGDDGQSAVAEIETKGGQATFVEMNATVADDCERAADETVARFGKLDIVHTNAYYGGANGLLVGDLTDQDWDLTINRTLTSAFLMSRAAIPYMLRQESGTFVFTASSQGLYASRSFSAYCVAKAGVIMLARSIAVDYGKAGIRANALCPGVTRTEYARHFIEALEPHYLENSFVPRINNADDVANGAVFLASDESRNMQGSHLLIDSGINLRHFASWDVEPLRESEFERGRALVAIRPDDDNPAN